jgi:hypothetical protein
MNETCRPQKKLAVLPSLDAIIAKLEAEFGCDKHLRVIDKHLFLYKIQRGQAERNR